MAGQGDVERVVVAHVVAQGPRALSKSADMRITVVDQQPAHPQRGVCFPAADDPCVLVSTQHIADLGIDHMWCMPDHPKHARPKDACGLGLTDYGEHDGRRIDDILRQRRSAARSARIDSGVAPGVLLASRAASIAANASSVVGRLAKSTTQSRMYD